MDQEKQNVSSNSEKSSFFTKVIEWIETLIAVALMGIATLFFILINGTQAGYQRLMGNKDDDAKSCKPEQKKTKQ